MMQYLIKVPSSATYINYPLKENNNSITLLQHENFNISTKDTDNCIEKNKR